METDGLHCSLGGKDNTSVYIHVVIQFKLLLSTNCTRKAVKHCRETSTGTHVKKGLAEPQSYPEGEFDLDAVHIGALSQPSGAALSIPGHILLKINQQFFQYPLF